MICAGNVLSAAPGHQEDGLALLQKVKYLAPKVAGCGFIRAQISRRKRYDKAIEEYKQLGSVPGAAEWTTPKLELAQIYIKTKSFEMQRTFLKPTLWKTKVTCARKNCLVSEGLNNDEENGWENFKRAVSREVKAQPVRKLMRRTTPQRFEKKEYGPKLRREKGR